MANKTDNLSKQADLTEATLAAINLDGSGDGEPQDVLYFDLSALTEANVVTGYLISDDVVDLTELFTSEIEHTGQVAEELVHFADIAEVIAQPVDQQFNTDHGINILYDEENKDTPDTI